MEQKFSVLLNIYAGNRPVWIEQVLNSILINTVKPSEIVILTDASVGKEIQAILDQAVKNKTVRVFWRPAAMTPVQILLFGIEKCSCDLIALSSGDSISLPDRFEKQCAYFSVHPETAVLGGWARKWDGETRLVTAFREVPEEETEIQTLIKQKDPFVYRTILFKKQSILSVRNDKGCCDGGELSLWKYIMRKGYKTANLPDVLVNTDSCVYKEQELSFSYFQKKKAWLKEMYQAQAIGFFTYYRAVCTNFVRCLPLPGCVSQGRRLKCTKEKCNENCCFGE